MERIAILDVDGTLLNWRDRFESWALHHKLIKPPMSNTYDFEPTDGIDINSVIHIFNETIHMTRLSPEVGAINAVEMLYKNGFALKICSSFSTEYGSMRLREKNLENVFGNKFSDYHFVPFKGTSATEDKIKYIANNVGSNLNEVYLFEDNPWVIKDAIEKGGLDPEQCFMLVQDFNVNHVGEMKNIGVNVGHWRNHLNTIFGE